LLAVIAMWGSLLMDLTNVGLSFVMGRSRAKPLRRTHINERVEEEARAADAI
jgi:hypothetical protein